jgi:hypothetical protein
MNTPNPKNRRRNKTIEDLIIFIEKASKSFTSSSSFKTQYHQNSDEDHLTEILVWHYNEEDRQDGGKYIFMPQPEQEGRRKVDIGIGLHDGHGNYIFCIEAKILPTSEYITGNTGAIKRFKKCEHGLSSSNPNNKKSLPHNAIVAYVKSDTFKKHFDKINKDIQKMAKSYSQKTDKFGLTWNNSEQLEKNYFDSIGRFSSKHPRQQALDVNLHHFWIYVKYTED